MPRTKEKPEPTKSEDLEGKASILLSVFIPRTTIQDDEAKRGEDTKTNVSSSSFSDCRLPLLLPYMYHLTFFSTRLIRIGHSFRDHTGSIRRSHHSWIGKTRRLSFASGFCSRRRPDRSVGDQCRLPTFCMEYTFTCDWDLAFKVGVDCTTCHRLVRMRGYDSPLFCLLVDPLS